jgi:hypothetical protein
MPKENERNPSIQNLYLEDIEGDNLLTQGLPQTSLLKVSCSGKF